MTLLASEVGSGQLAARKGSSEGQRGRAPQQRPPEREGERGFHCFHFASFGCVFFFLTVASGLLVCFSCVPGLAIPARAGTTGRGAV